MADYIGVIGLCLILAGWVWEFYQTLKNRKAGVPLSFALLYGAGSMLLTIYSIQLGDLVFIILNAAATLIAVANAAFAVSRNGEKKRAGRGKKKRVRL